MNNITPVPKFSIHPPVHHTNLKVRSTEPPLNKDLHQIFQDSLEFDSEISVQEIKFHSNLQKQNQNHESLMKEMERDSLEEESPQFQNLSESEEISNEAVKLSRGNHPPPQVPGENKSQELLVDKYSDLRYDPNWKNSKGEISTLKRLQLTEKSSTQNFSWDPLYSSKETSFELSKEKNDLEKSPQSSVSLLGSEFLSSNYERGDLNSESISFVSTSDLGDKSTNLSEHIKSSSSHNDVFLPGPRLRPKKSKQDIVEKNKVTLGLSIHNTGSYLYQHNKKMGGIHPEKISSTVVPDTKPKSNEEGENPAVDPEDKWHQGVRLQDYQEQWSRSERTKFTQVSRQLPSETTDGRPASRRKGIRKIRRQYKLGSGPISPNSHIKPNVPKKLDVSQSNQNSMPREQYKQIKSDGPSLNLEHTINLNKPVTHLQDLNAFRPQHYKEAPGNFSLSKKLFNKPTYKKPAGFNTLLHINEERGHQSFQESSSLIYRFNLQPDWDFSYINRSSKKHQKGSKSTSNMDNQGSFENKTSTQRQRTQTYSEASYSNLDMLWKFCPSSESQPARVSPDTQLTHIMEQHQQALMQLTEVQPSEVTSNTVFPSIVSRVDSESQLNTEKSQRSQTTLSRCNSEGYLLQLEKQKKHKDRVASKNYRLKGYQKKEVKLGGLGPDFESLKDKIKKLKQQKQYAKQVKEYNMKVLSSGSKPQTAKPESKPSISRQKALEYARKIPKPKPPNLNDQESKQDRNQPCSGKEMNLPEISLLEVLQNRHEREKQAVAAFKVLHIV